MITVPYTKPHTATRDAINAAGFPWVARYVGKADDSYFDLLTELWSTGETFTIVEHDIAPTREALASLDECGNDWCACPYPYLYGQPATGLGCTRFRGSVIHRNPDLMSVVASMSDAGHPPRHWCRLDAWMFQTLSARGETRCEAHPGIAHHMTQRGSAHGCYVIN